MSGFISSTVLIKSKASFLNGEGNTKEAKGEITKVKHYKHRGTDVPYVSAQAWRKWIRDAINYFRDEIGYYDRLYQKKPNKEELKNPRGLTVDPVKYIEDDVFGYSHPLLNTPHQEDAMRHNIVTANRSSPYQTTALLPVKGTTYISRMEGWIHPIEDTPLPFKSEIFSGFLEGFAVLDLDRVGQFRVYGDIIEIDPEIADLYLKDGELVLDESDNMRIYHLKHKAKRVEEAYRNYFHGLLNVSGYAKQTQFANDLSPKILIAAILNFPNNLFTKLFSVDRSKNIFFDIDRLFNIIKNRGHTIKSNILIGYRSGTFKEEYEKKLLELNEKLIDHKNGSVKIEVTTPGQVENKLSSIIIER